MAHLLFLLVMLGIILVELCTGKYKIHTVLFYTYYCEYFSNMFEVHITIFPQKMTTLLTYQQSIIFYIWDSRDTFEVCQCTKGWLLFTDFLPAMCTDKNLWISEVSLSELENFQHSLALPD